MIKIFCTNIEYFYYIHTFLQQHTVCILYRRQKVKMSAVGIKINLRNSARH